jgi:hypothetical protein
MKKWRIRVLVGCACLFTAYVSFCLFRVADELSRFEGVMYESPSSLETGIDSDDLLAYYRSRDLLVVMSMKPFLKNPVRNDVRLYFAFQPKLNTIGADAYASNEFGQWKMKIHN